MENVVANLGTSLTTRQILTFNQFFEHITVCFDGDESGYKAALRAAENSIIELKPEKKISFYFYLIIMIQIVLQMKMGKIFLKIFQKIILVPIHKFIFNHYSKEIDDNPSSRAIFEKKLRSISSTIKDEFIKKYVLEYFLEKISELTPNTNKKNKKKLNKNLQNHSNQLRIIIMKQSL